jgi:hypothetical protein
MIDPTEYRAMAAEQHPPPIRQIGIRSAIGAFPALFSVVFEQVPVSEAAPRAGALLGTFR